MLSQVSSAFVNHTQAILDASNSSPSSTSSNASSYEAFNTKQEIQRLHQLKQSFVPSNILPLNTALSHVSYAHPPPTSPSAPNNPLTSFTSTMPHIKVNSHGHAKDHITSVSPHSVVGMASPNNATTTLQLQTPTDESLLLSAPNRILSFRECERILTAVDSYVKTLRSLTKQNDRQDALHLLLRICHPFVQWILACHRGFMHNTIRWIDQFSRIAGFEELVSIDLLLRLYSRVLPPTTDVIEEMELSWQSEYQPSSEDLETRPKLLDFLTRTAMNAQGASMLFDELKVKLLADNWISSLTQDNEHILDPLQHVIGTLENVKDRWKRFNAKEWITTLEQSISRFHVDEVEGVRTSVHQNYSGPPLDPHNNASHQHDQHQAHQQPPRLSDEPPLNQDEDHDSLMQDEPKRPESVTATTCTTRPIPIVFTSKSHPPSPPKLTDGFRSKSVLFASGCDVLRYDRDEAPINCNKRVKSILRSRDRSATSNSNNPSHMAPSEDLLILRAVQPTIVPTEHRQDDLAAFQSQLYSPTVSRSVDAALDKDDFIRCAPLSETTLARLQDGYIVSLKELLPSGRKFYPSVGTLRKLYFDRLLPALLFQQNPYISHWSALWMQVTRLAQEVDEHKPMLSKLQACVTDYMAPIVGLNWSSPEVENRNWQLQLDLDHAMKLLKETIDDESSSKATSEPANQKNSSNQATDTSNTAFQMNSEPVSSMPATDAKSELAETNDDGQTGLIIATNIVGKFANWTRSPQYGEVFHVDPVTNRPMRYEFHIHRVECQKEDLKSQTPVMFDLFKTKTSTYASAIRLHRINKEQHAQVKVTEPTVTTATLLSSASSSSVPSNSSTTSCTSAASSCTISSSSSATSAPMSDSGYPFPPMPEIIRTASLDSVLTNGSRSSMEDVDQPATHTSVEQETQKENSSHTELSPSKRQKTEGGFRPVETTVQASIYPYPPSANFNATSNAHSSSVDDVAKQPASLPPSLKSAGSEKLVKSHPQSGQLDSALRAPSTSKKRSRELKRDTRACEYYNFTPRGCKFGRSGCRYDHICAYVECPDRFHSPHTAMDCKLPHAEHSKPRLAITLSKGATKNESHKH